MEQKQIHKHYLGKAHTFDILTEQEIAKSDYLREYAAAAYAFEIENPGETRTVTILKTFFINDMVNLNDWQATWEGLKEDAKDLPGTPLVLQEDLEHPKYSVQKYYDRGTIIDYSIDEEKHQIIVYVRITDPSIIERIKSGELQFVSPAVIPRGSEYMQTINGVDILRRTLPLHLAIVGSPAYGEEAAKMTHLCTGEGTACLQRLKIMTAARKIFDSADDCVSRKIQIIKRERPSISNDQAAAIAYSMCRKGEANIDSLEQIPLIKKILGRTAKIASIFEKIKSGNDFYTWNGNRGVWIKAKGMDVFVANNEPISQALMAQCGCDLLTKSTVTKEEAHYRDTDSKVQNCTTCVFYNSSRHSCDVVQGEITPGHTSDLWKSKYN